MKRSVFLISKDVHTLELLRICKKLYSVGYRKHDINYLIGMIIIFDYTDFDIEVTEAIYFIMSDLEEYRGLLK